MYACFHVLRGGPKPLSWGRWADELGRYDKEKRRNGFHWPSADGASPCSQKDRVGASDNSRSREKDWRHGYACGCEGHESGKADHGEKVATFIQEAMKREDTRTAYYDLTAKLSEITRQLSFAGIALVWIFKVDSSEGPRVPASLLWPAVLVIGALAADFLQYAYSSAAWGIFNRLQEKRGIREETDFRAPRAINWPTVCFLWLKVVLVAIAYVGFLSYLRGAIAAA